ncbi:MAG: hypothetical protein UY04_C0017G0008 [Parcubacteria group bacterium GW2011_GWA2_47_7]|nr:MAG: hypothetical protein UY04_C0017G0008 [Parcubacteria group bacterium GW2011_GWA2_47_7]
MNVSVVLFFVHNVLATVLLGSKFVRRSDPVFRYFGIGLLLDALAFAMWTLGYLNPDQLLNFITFGAIALLVSFVFFLYASLQQVASGARSLVTMLGVVAILGIFYVGRYGDPASGDISPEGLLFFNLTPLVQMLYIFALAFVAFPVIDIVASRFKAPYSTLIRYGLIAEVVGGILLITSKDVQVLYIMGWIIGVVYAALWGTLFFSKKAWSSVS